MVKILKTLAKAATHLQDGLQPSDVVNILSGKKKLKPKDISKKLDLIIHNQIAIAEVLNKVVEKWLKENGK